MIRLKFSDVTFSVIPLNNTCSNNFGGSIKIDYYLIEFLNSKTNNSNLYILKFMIKISSNIRKELPESSPIRFK